MHPREIGDERIVARLEPRGTKGAGEFAALVYKPSILAVSMGLLAA
jgi:hypothetical protein